MTAPSAPTQSASVEDVAQTLMPGELDKLVIGIEHPAEFVSQNVAGVGGLDEGVVEPLLFEDGAVGFDLVADVHHQGENRKDPALRVIQRGVVPGAVNHIAGPGQIPALTHVGAFTGLGETPGEQRHPRHVVGMHDVQIQKLFSNHLLGFPAKEVMGLSGP